MSTDSPWGKGFKAKGDKANRGKPARGTPETGARTSSKNTKDEKEDKKKRVDKRSPYEKKRSNPKNRGGTRVGGRNSNFAAKKEGRPSRRRDDTSRDDTKRNNRGSTETFSAKSRHKNDGAFRNRAEREEGAKVQKVANPLKRERKPGLAKVDTEGVVEVQGERLQKVLATQGFGSRREIEQVMLDGEVFVDNEIATLGMRVLGGESVSFKGKEFIIPSVDLLHTEVLIYHKPVGQICSRKDAKMRPIVFDYIPKPKSGRWVMIGRLDINTSGLLIFTNNGALANAMMHPSNEVLRHYRVRVFGDLADDAVHQLINGVELEDGPAKFETCEFVAGRAGNRWYNVSLAEGRNREVRRMWLSVGGTVSRLIRTAYGPIELAESLKNGQSRWAQKTEMSALAKISGFELKSAVIGDGSVYEEVPQEKGRGESHDENHAARKSRYAGKSTSKGRNNRPYGSKASRSLKDGFDKSKEKSGTRGFKSSKSASRNGKSGSSAYSGKGRATSKKGNPYKS